LSPPPPSTIKDAFNTQIAQVAEQSSWHKLIIADLQSSPLMVNTTEVQLKTFTSAQLAVTSLVKLDLLVWRLNSLHPSVIAQWLNSHSISKSLASPSDITGGNVVL
jgi:hypothetical protein